MPENRTSFYTGQQSVTASGTPVQLPDIRISGGVFAVIKAKKSNTGKITIGDTSAKALNTGNDHFSLEANESVKLLVTNLDKVWIDSTVNGEGVEIILEL